MISINWGTKVIYVPRADMTLVQSPPPIEIRELDLDAFRLALKDLEDDAAGMASPDTHRHETETTLGGILYARKIEIVNGYTVTFEDGQYAVNLVGANSNLMDVLNPNQVSVRSANSAGLIISETTDINEILQSIGVAILDGQEVVPGVSLRQAQMLKLSALIGKLQGATGGEDDEWVEIIEALSDDRVRVRALCDQYGNRKQIQIDLDSA